jgi:hypothetical protein
MTAEPFATHGVLFPDMPAKLLFCIAPAALVIAAASPSELPGQVVTLDDGSFTILHAGQPVGREVFSIRSTPGVGGSVVQSTATITYDDRRLAPVLRTDAAGVPSAYQLDVRAGTEVVETFRGDVRRGRFSATIQTPRGESRRDYVVSADAMILDEEIFHHYYFLDRGARVGKSSVPVVVPRRNVQVDMALESHGASEVVIGDRTIPATRYRLSDPTGDTRDVWLDSRGRVLRVEIPSRGISALRDAPPRNQ